MEPIQPKNPSKVIIVPRPVSGNQTPVKKSEDVPTAESEAAENVPVEEEKKEG